MRRTVAKRAVIAALITMGVLGLEGSPASAQPVGAPSGDDSSRVVKYENTVPLDNAEVMTVTGKSTGDGGCSFLFPDLELAPDETAIEARQIETNFSNCTTKVEIGTPREAGAKTQSGSRSVTETAKPGDPAVGRANGLAAAPSPAALAKTGEQATRATNAPARVAATTSSGYWRVWWEDVIHLRVHEVKSNVRWSWDGSSCVWGYSGWTDYWWLSGTGWSKNSSNQAIYPSCSIVDYTSVAVYRNGAFCWPGVVWSVYDNVRVQGRYDGWLFGNVTNTYSTYPFACPTLHWHSELRRTAN